MKTSLLAEDNEFENCETKHYNYLIFGHRHLPMKVSVGENSNINLGDWISYLVYVF
jgi:UDP-2,3-diacylglucosamine hydrolase